MAQHGSKQDWSSRLRQMNEQAKQNLADGAFTPAYKANRDEILDLLNRALASEWSSFLQYHHHYIMASDIHSAEIREMWQEHAEEEREHAQKIADRIDQLGGVPVHDPQQIAQLTPTPFEAGHDLRNMLEIDLVGERETILFYNEIVRTCGFDDNETRVLFENILLTESEHANEIANLLYQQDASTGKLIPNIHERVVGESGQKARGAM
jgi:bacterioferritin